MTISGRVIYWTTWFKMMLMTMMTLRIITITMTTKRMTTKDHYWQGNLLDYLVLAEVRYVHAVTAGGSVKFLPAV